MSDDATRLLAAQEAIRAGNKPHARRLLQAELSENPQNFRAWLWLAGLAESAEASMDYVREAERLNPRDPGVRKARAWAEQRLARQPSAMSKVTGAPRQEAGAVGREETVTARRIEALRQAQQATATAEVARPRGKRRLLFAAMLVLAATALLTIPLWSAAARSMVFGTPPGDGSAMQEATVPEAAATPEVPSTAVAPVSDGETSAVSFVSGHFSPKANAAPVEDRADAIDDGSNATATPAPLEPKAVNNNDDDPRPTWTLTPSPTLMPTATPTPVPTFISQEQVVVGGVARPAGVGPNERWIDVNLTTQTLVAYEGDRAVFNSLISSGTWLHPTVTGQFRVWLRYTAQTMDGRRLGYDYYLPNVPYVMYFYRDYALHGTYWHSNFGTPMSHGCVNLPTPAAEWIFNWSSIGTLVSVHY